MPNLSTTHGCLREFEDCSNGLTYFDHLFHLALDELDEAREGWEPWKAEGLDWARRSLGKGATAGELQSKLIEWAGRDQAATASLTRLREAERNKAKLDRFIASLEKRLTAAQSALRGHEQLSRYAGGQP